MSSCSCSATGTRSGRRCSARRASPPAPAPGTLLINATTIGPDEAREFAAEADRAGLRYVDAPVAGSVRPATDGTLGVFVGGADDAVAAARPVLGLWGAADRIQHVGPVGAGSALKLVVNLSIGVAIEGVGEALRLAADLGVDRTRALDALAAGPLSPTLAQKRSMLDGGDFSETAFSVQLLAKDLGLAVRNGRRPLPATEAALAAARDTAESGHADDDYVAVAAAVEAPDSPEG